MNHSIHSADRSTHLKIVIIALVAGGILASFGFAAREGGAGSGTQTARVMKAGKTVVFTSSDTVATR
jgi:hypothetical protein